MTTKRIFVNGHAFQYINSVLASGNTLARILSKTLCIESGRVAAFIESVNVPADSEGYERGGIATRDESLEQLTSHLASSVQQSDTMYLLENRCARRLDPVVSTRYKSRMVYLNDEIYHVIIGPEETPESISLTIREADTSNYLVGVGFPKSIFLLDAGVMQLSADGLSRIASEATSLLVEAFDGESFLIWEGRKEKGTQLISP